MTSWRRRAPMNGRLAGLSGMVLMLVALACEQSISAPGACPAFCPPNTIAIQDTILFDTVERDSAYQGYVQPYEAVRMPMASGGQLESRGIARFLPFASEIFVGGETGEFRPVVQTDSFRLTLQLRDRSENVTGIALRMHRLPATIDSGVTFADLDPYFADSTLIGTLAVPDGVFVDTITTRVPVNAFPTLEEDGLQAAIGFAVQAPQPAFVAVGTMDIQLSPVLARFVQVDSANGELSARVDSRGAAFDSYRQTPSPPLDETTLAVGSAPSIRSLLRFNVPPRILDSSDVVGATLILVPVQPAIGAPADSVRLVANSLGADFGPKSPVLPTTSASADTLLPGTPIPVGSTDSVSLDITNIIAEWQTNRGQPRSIMLRLFLEGSVLGEFRFGSSRRPDARPVLRITFIPPVEFENR